MEESEKLKGEGNNIKFIDLRFERVEIVGFGKEEGKMFHRLHVLGINDDWWDKVHGVGSETWKGCE